MTTNTQHFLNEATLIRGIARDEVESFADIPEHLVTDTIIRHWIVRSPLDGVPLHRLNHIMRDMAVAANPENIKFFNPQNCDNYTHLLKTALCNPFFDIKHAVIEEITPQLLVASYKKNGGCISEYMKYKVWPSDEDRIDFANNLIALDPWLLVAPPVKIYEIRDECIVKFVEKLNVLDFFVSRLIKLL